MRVRDPSYWGAYLEASQTKRHRWWVESNGARGQRIELDGLDLHGALVGETLARARLVRCDLSESRCQICSFKDAQLVECSFEDAWLNMCGFEGAQVDDCSFVRAELSMSHWRDARYQRNDWSRAILDRSSFDDCQVVRGRFCGASVLSTSFVNATLEDCDFRDALLCQEPTCPYFGGVQGAMFIRCDFRGADLTGMRLDRATFSDCKFAGIKGLPAILGPVTITNADLSEAGDGSQLVGGAELLHRWTTGAGST